MSLIALLDNNKHEMQIDARGILYEPGRITDYHEILLARFHERRPMQMAVEGDLLGCAKSLHENKRIVGYRSLDNHMAYLYMKKGAWHEVMQHLQEHQPFYNQPQP